MNRRVWRTPSAGSLSTLSISDEPLPLEVPKGHYRIEVCAIGLNFADIFALLGLYSATPTGSFIPGLEFSGVVIGIGEEEEKEECQNPFSHSQCQFCTNPIPLLLHGHKYKIGDRVMGVIRFGAYATHLDIPPTLLRPLPPHFNFADGASLMAQFLTAWYAMFDLGNAGDTTNGKKTTLIHSAAGGVGLFGVWLCQQLKYPIIATVGSPQKVEFLNRVYGIPIEQIIVRNANQFGQQLDTAIQFIEQNKPKTSNDISQDHTAIPGGIDIILDSLFGPYFNPAYTRLNPEGRYIIFGAGDMMSQGDSPSWLSLGWKYYTRPTIDPLNMISENKSMMAFNLIWLTHKLDKFEKTYHFILHIVYHLWNSTLPKPHIGRIFSFDEIPQALKYFQSGKSIGKVVILIKEEEGGDAK
jgi:synaptic vesicle membrane protein VAT-1